MLAPECDLSVGSHINAERHLLGEDVMNKFGHVTFVDGHPSLEGENNRLPAYTYTCYTYTCTHTYPCICTYTYTSISLQQHQPPHLYTYTYTYTY
jgi:hypothetical protein